MTHTTQPSKPRSKATPWLIGAAVLSLCCLGGVVIAIVSSDISEFRPIPTNTTTSGYPFGKPAEQPKAQPNPSDFALTVKILEKKCFGSAGCNVQYRIELAYLGTVPLDSTAYDLTYEVKGGDDPQIGTLTIQGDQYEQDRTQYIQTPSSKSVLTAVVTSISPA